MHPTTGAADPGHYRADTDDLGHLVDRTRGHLDELHHLEERLRARRLQVTTALGEPSGSWPQSSGWSLDHLIGDVAGSGRFAEGVLGDLLAFAPEGPGYRPALARAIAEGRLDPPDDPIRQRVLQAVEAGLSPDDVGIDAAYFPAPVVRHRWLTGRLAIARAARVDAGRRPVAGRPGEGDPLEVLDSRIDRLEAQLEELTEHGLDRGGRVTGLAAVALVADATGGPAWEGRHYGRAFAAHHDAHLDDGPFGLAAPHLGRPTGFVDEFDDLSPRVAADPAVAIAFYNEIGVERAADLATFVVGADDDGQWAGDTLGRLGRGLALASVGDPGDRRSRLGFGGDTLIEVERPQLGRGVVGYSPALLLVDGAFADRFLADALGATLRLAADGDPRGFETHWGWEVVGLPPSVVERGGGEDPRNILLDRAARRPEVVGAVVEDLAERAIPVEGSGGSLAPGFRPLIRPDEPFRAAADPPDDRGWRSIVGGILDEAPSLRPSPVVQPPLDHPYPITAFLDAVAADAQLSRLVMVATADSVAAGDGGPIVGDVGTAAGLDLVLAAHAPLMVPPDALEAVGIEASDLNDGVIDRPPRGWPRRGRPPGSDRAVGPPEWKAVHQQVLHWGRGQVLAMAADRLLSDAIVGAVDDRGRFLADFTDPFAQLAGRAEAEAHEATIVYARHLDDEARRRDAHADRAVAMATAAAGLVPGLGVAAALVGVGWAWFHDGGTSAELDVYRSLWFAEHVAPDAFRWKREAAAASMLSSIGDDGRGAVDLLVPGLGVRSVPIRSNGWPGGFDWRHPTTGQWQPMPHLADDDAAAEVFPHYEGLLIRQVIGAADDVAENYRDGVDLAWMDRDGSDLATRRSLVDVNPDVERHAGWTGEWLGSA